MAEDARERQRREEQPLETAQGIKPLQGCL